MSSITTSTCTLDSPYNEFDYYEHLYTGFPLQRVRLLRAPVHWIPLTTSSITTSTCTLDSPYNEFDYYEHLYTGFPLQRVRLLRAPVHWVPLTTSSDNTSQCPIIDYNVKMFRWNENPATKNTFLYIKLLVVSGTKCT